MNCLVLGGGGFIGRHLCAALVAAGHQVGAFGRLPVGDWIPIAGVSYQCGDVQCERSLKAALVDVDVVYHLISVTIPKTSNENPLVDLQGNVAVTLGLLDVIVGMDKQVELIFLSSGGTVYGIPRITPIPEDHPTNPLCAYGVGKLAIEKYLALYHHLHDLNYRILRLANPYGSQQAIGRGQGVIAAFLARALRHETLEIWGDGSVVRDYLYISDLCVALLAILHYNGPQRIFNIGSGSGHSLNDLIAMISQLLGREVRTSFQPGRSCDVPVNILDIQRARAELNWQPTIPMVEGIASLLPWLQSL